MRRRITEAIVGVTALILLVLGIPLAIAVHQSVLDREVVELQAAAARTLTEIAVPLDSAQLATVNDEPDAPPPFGVYGVDAVLIAGDGPTTGDAAVLSALAGNQASTTNGEIVVATPITDGASEHVVGALRLSESLAGADHRSRMAWLVMIAFGLAAIALAWAIARRVARRLSQPVTDLAAAAARIGDGGATVERTAPSGITEIDTLANALVDSSERVNEALMRERRFSADVSHQLRTPLTALRLRLEASRGDAGTATIDAALADLDRIDETVEHLLVFARDAMPAASTVDLDEVARSAADRGRDRVIARNRTLTTSTPESLVGRGSGASFDQILDVLIDNALEHGRGSIDIVERRIAGGVAIDIRDEGDSIADVESERIFERGHGDNHGIGLALARSIAEAEGGRLLLSRAQPTTFTLIILLPDQNGDQ